MIELRVRSERQEELIDITGMVGGAVSDWSSAKAVLIYVPHTTAGVLVNEHADSDVARDITFALSQIVPEGGDYRHVEGNSPAHVKAVLVGSSQIVPMEAGRLSLGTWQGIFFAEFDGPRTRKAWLTPL